MDIPVETVESMVKTLYRLAANNEQTREQYLDFDDLSEWFDGRASAYYIAAGMIERLIETYKDVNVAEENDDE